MRNRHIVKVRNGILATTVSSRRFCCGDSAAKTKVGTISPAAISTLQLGERRYKAARHKEYRPCIEMSVKPSLSLYLDLSV